MPQPRAIKAPESLRSAFNFSGAAIAINRLVNTDPTPSVAGRGDAIVAQATSNGTVLGVTTEAAPDADGVGRTIQVRDRALCVAGAAITVGDLVMPTTAGKVLTRTGTNTIVGEAKTAALADLDIIEVELNLPASGI
ncbi:MAG: capsid cement protein [Planctomycetota bacterium]